MSSASMLAMERGSSRSSDSPQVRLERMFIEQHALIWRTLRRLGFSPALAADVTEQVLRDVAKELGGAAAPDERIKVLRLVMRQLGRYADAEAVPASGMASADLMDRVLLRMTRPGVMTFILFELEGLSLAEVADVMVMAEDVALRTLMRAREEFTSLVADLRRASEG